jgi:2-keto-4-pentenoate hydratase/2-oxohepta-3-ene-1,7-dioic acid hydratase in catechol pathway
VVFSRFASTLAAHGQSIAKPQNVRSMDYEAELAVIIGKPGRFLTGETALDHVAGFTCFNDISMREWQMMTTQWMPGKNFPNSGPLGPVLIPRDEFLPGFDQRRIRLILNGTVMQESHFGQFIFDLPTLIAHISQFVHLQPGDVIATGTPGGVGYMRKPPVLLEPGSTVTVDIEGIGALTNTIV